MASDLTDATRDIVIRPAVPHDMARIAEIVSITPVAAQWSAESLLQMAASGALIWVAESAELVSGFLAARNVGGEFEILNLAVAAQNRRQGIARQLLQIAVATAAHSACTQVYLEVRASNRPALALYAAQGFIEGGRRRGYYRNPDDDALILSLSLTK